LSLGSNMGNRWDYLTTAVSTLTIGRNHRISDVFETAPWGGVEQDPFWNLVLELTTETDAFELLAQCHATEAAAARTREVRWGPRTLDVDIIVIEGESYDTPDLVVPHPRYRQRRFVLAPLAQLRPDLVSATELTEADGDVVVLGTLESLH